MVRSSAADTVPNISPARDAKAGLLVDAVRQRAVGPLVESMVHDLRNPLNALAINLEVLTEKLRAETGEVPGTQEKNLRAIRDQIQRMDALLRRFSEFLLDRPRPDEATTFSTLLQASLEVLSPELRRKRLKLQMALAADLRVNADPSTLRFLCIQALLWSVEHASVGEELRVTLRAGNGEAVLELDGAEVGTAAPEEGSSGTSLLDVEAALQLVAAGLGGRIEIEGGRCTVALPLAEA